MSLSVVKPITVSSGNLTTLVPIPDSYTGEVFWSNATSYTIGATVLSSATDPTFYTTNIPGIYRALTGGITAINPENDPVNWEFVKVANKYRMFDTESTFPTNWYTALTVIVAPVEAMSHAAFYGLYADTVWITLTDSLANVVFDQTFSLRRPPLLATWYNYFFDSFQNYTELVVNLPSYRNASLSATIRRTSGGITTACSKMIVGKADVITDDLEYGAAMGVTDYSRKEKDPVFGTDSNFIRRGYSKHVDFAFIINNESKDAVMQYLTELRGTPALYVMDGITSVLGYYQDFKITIPYAAESVCTLSLEGLTQ